MVYEIYNVYGQAVNGKNTGMRALILSKGNICACIEAID